MLATDGVTIGIDTYGTPPTWPDALALVEEHGAAALLDVIHETEDTDPDARRWPRSKRHDDKALAVVAFV